MARSPLTRLVSLPIDPFVGALYPLRAAWTILRTPKLWGYLVAPIAVNVVVALGLYFALLLPGLDAIDGLQLRVDARASEAIAQLPQWLHWLDAAPGIFGGLLDFVAIVLLLLVTGFAIAQFGTLLGAPWYGQLAERIERDRLGAENVPKSEGALAIVRDISRALLFEVKKLLLVAVLLVVFVAIGSVPVVGTLVAGAGGIITGATIACLDFLDAPQERRRWRFRRKLRTVLAEFPATAGFGLVCLFAVSIPIVNLVSVPVCVTAGTLFFCDRVFPGIAGKSGESGD
ncbi:MAG: EI24 domain-containing protein [Geitlerinemataceae cyanobacterium]